MKGMSFYGLDENNNVVEISVFDSINKGQFTRVGYAEPILGTTVSTIFLGINISWGTTPQYFETSVSSSEADGFEHMERYTTWQEAVDGHARCCQMVIDSLEKRND